MCRDTYVGRYVGGWVGEISLFSTEHPDSYLCGGHTTNTRTIFLGLCIRGGLISLDMSSHSVHAQALEKAPDGIMNRQRDRPTNPPLGMRSEEGDGDSC